MTAFVAIAGLLAIGALAFVVVPLLRRRPGAGLSRDAINVAVYRDQLRELETDLRAGTLGQDQYDRSRGEIEARLLQDVNRPDPARRLTPPSGDQRSRKTCPRDDISRCCGRTPPPTR